MHCGNTAACGRGPRVDRSGLVDGATTWTAQQVDAAGPGATRAIEQVRAWQFSRVLQVEMEQECLSFRARQGRTPARRESESRVVYHLARRAVTFVPDVVAVNSYARGF